MADELGLVVTVLADLPGPKIRIGRIAGGQLELVKGQKLTLTTRSVEGQAGLIPVRFKEFSQSVRRGSRVYLNDGFIQLKVLEVAGEDVFCRVQIGGLLLSNKGLNLPDARLAVEPVTARDLELIEFGLEAGVDAFCASFIEKAEDIVKIKDFAASRGQGAFVVAKIERREAIANIEAILKVADGLMIARGDLGVEIPIEQVPVFQKELIFRANLAGRPVITATQMLESMTVNIRPTRAEVTDVANAILDGTDAVMLSEETAIGHYPIEACGMLRRIARITDARRASLVTSDRLRAALLDSLERAGASTEDVLSLDVLEALKAPLGVRFVLAPTDSGGTPRRIARYKSPVWTLAFTPFERVRNQLMLSYGVWPILLDEIYVDEILLDQLRDDGLLRPGERVLIARRNPDGPRGKVNSLAIVTLLK
ncbi:MAG: Pyruvate kinase [Deltaproteobacteria bacterium ADurb.Bin510]|nr:MAG: Pyruvate kinase [Deltaproteobacteria bacterium ADurb.Bin510]